MESFDQLLLLVLLIQYLRWYYYCIKWQNLSIYPFFINFYNTFYYSDTAVPDEHDSRTGSCDHNYGTRQPSAEPPTPPPSSGDPTIVREIVNKLLTDDLYLSDQGESDSDSSNSNLSNKTANNSSGKNI